jgi:hypothetical protein
MDYLKELEAIQTWIKQTTGLNSYRLREAKPKLARPVILWETPSRSRDRNLSRYQYVTTVRQYGRLFVTSLDSALTVQEQLIKDLEEKVGVLPVMDGQTQLGLLKAVTIEFEDGENLDIPFSIRYEATYGRTRPAEAPNATYVGNRIINHYDE